MQTLDILLFSYSFGIVVLGETCSLLQICGLYMLCCLMENIQNGIFVCWHVTYIRLFLDHLCSNWVWLFKKNLTKSLIVYFVFRNIGYIMGFFTYKPNIDNSKKNCFFIRPLCM